jgi:hypothetical protein
VDALLARTAKQERDLVVNQRMNLDRARELLRRELFPEDLNPWPRNGEWGPLPQRRTPRS